MPSAYQIHGRTQYSWTSTDALENLRLNKDVPKPTDIPKGHALVRIRAAALNARDMMVVAHDPIYPGPHVDDLVPCCDAAGEISAVGPDSKFKVGDKVVISPVAWMDWQYHVGGEDEGYMNMNAKGAGNVQGLLQEYAVIEDNQLIHAPKHLTFEESAAILSAGATAVHALLFGPRTIRPGQTVLTQGTGGVSCSVIQIASALGAIVIATSSSDTKLAQARALGATHTINYTTHPNWETEVLRLTGGKGVDLVVEVVGSATIGQSLRATKHFGVVAMVGFLAGSKKTDLTPEIIFGAKTIYGVMAFTKSMVEELCRLVEDKGLRPAVGMVCEWEDAKSGFVALSKQAVVGKIVIKVGGEE